MLSYEPSASHNIFCNITSKITTQKYFKNDQNVTQTHKVSTCYWRNGTDRRAQQKLLQIFNLLKKNKKQKPSICRAQSEVQ